MALKVQLAPLAKQQFNQYTTSNGITSWGPLNGGQLFTYAAGTTTKQATYTDESGATPNTNPIILDADGQCNCWLDERLSYKLTLSPSTDTDPPTNAYWTVDNVTGGVGYGNGVSMVASGADGTGVVDCNTVLANVFANLPAGGMIIFDAGYTFKLSTALLNGKACTIYAEGATINCNAATGALHKTDNVGPLKVVGGNWVATGTATCINYTCTPTSNTSIELIVDRGVYTSANAYAIYLNGPYGVLIDACKVINTAVNTATYINSQGGIYCTQTNNPYISNTFFVGTQYSCGFWADGRGQPTSANPILDKCVILGWGYSAIVSGCDDAHIVNCTIDYAFYHNLTLASQDTFTIEGGYMRAGGQSNNIPALEIVSAGVLGYGPDACRLGTVIGVAFTCHQVIGNLCDTVQIGGFIWDVTNSGNTPAPGNTALFPAFITVDECTFTLYTRYGISFSTVAQLTITNNAFNQFAGVNEPTQLPVYNYYNGGDSLVQITDNQMPPGTSLVGSQLNFAQVFNNMGCPSVKAQGVAGMNAIFAAPNAVCGLGGYGSFYLHAVNATGPFVMDRYAGPPTIRLRRADGAFGSGTSVTTLDVCGAVYFDAYDGTNYNNIGGISAFAAGPTTSVSSPGILDIDVTASGPGTTTPVMEFSGTYGMFNPTGNLNIGTSTSIPLLFGTAAGCNPASASNVGMYFGLGTPSGRITPSQNVALYYNGSATSAGTVQYMWQGSSWTAVAVP